MPKLVLRPATIGRSQELARPSKFSGLNRSCDLEEQKACWSWPAIGSRNRSQLFNRPYSCDIPFVDHRIMPVGSAQRSRWQLNVANRFCDGLCLSLEGPPSSLLIALLVSRN